MPKRIKERTEIDRKFTQDNALVEFFDINKHGKIMENKFHHDRLGDLLIDEMNVCEIDGLPHIYHDGIYEGAQMKLEKRIAQYCPILKDHQIREVYKYLSRIAPEVKTKKQDVWYICFKNCIVDVRDMKPYDFTPDIVIQNKIPWDYNPDVDVNSEGAQAIEKSLNAMSSYDGKPDPACRRLMEEIVGYCFLRRNELRKFFILLGDKRNGKSTFLETLITLIGEENTSTVDMKDLSEKFTNATMAGKLLNSGDDISDEFNPDLAVFKKLVAGNPLTVQHKGGMPFNMKSYAKQVFSANTLPRIKDPTGAVADRLIAVPFDHEFDKNDPDYDPWILDKMTSKEGMEYLILLGLRAVQDLLICKEFTVPDRVKRTVAEYNKENNPILQYFDERGRDHFLRHSTLAMYSDYSAWCRTYGFKEKSRPGFSRAICKHFRFKSEPRNGERIFVDY